MEVEELKYNCYSTRDIIAAIFFSIFKNFVLFALTGFITQYGCQ